MKNRCSLKRGYRNDRAGSRNRGCEAENCLARTARHTFGVSRRAGRKTASQVVQIFMRWELLQPSWNRKGNLLQNPQGAAAQHTRELSQAPNRLRAVHGTVIRCGGLDL